MSEEEEQREGERRAKLTRLHLIKDLELMQLKGVHPDPIAKQLMNNPLPNRDQLTRRVMTNMSNHPASANPTIRMPSVQPQSRKSERKERCCEKAHEPIAFLREVNKSRSLIRSCRVLKPKLITNRSIGRLLRQSHRDYNRLLGKEVTKFSLQEAMR